MVILDAIVAVHIRLWWLSVELMECSVVYI